MSSKDPIHLEDRDKAGARLFSPTAARNKDPISQVINEHIPEDARVLEIAAGTGEHAAYICGLRPDITWQPSDPNAESRASQDDWAEDCSGNMLQSLNIDTTLPNWTEDLSGFDVIYCANMIHIAAWEAALGMAAGASKLLSKGQKFILYGPFIEGEDTSESNLAFDQNLKRRNPSWGVRDIEEVKRMFAEAGFAHEARVVMPKENRTLIFMKV